MQDTCSNLDFIHCCARFCFQLHLQNLTQKRNFEKAVFERMTQISEM